MKIFVVLLLNLFSIVNPAPANEATLRLIGTIEEKNENYLALKIEEVVAFGTAIRVVPDEGDRIIVRLPGQRPPENHSRVVIDVQENIEIGGTQSAYIMKRYQTIESTSTFISVGK